METHYIEDCINNGHGTDSRLAKKQFLLLLDEKVKLLSKS